MNEKIKNKLEKALRKIFDDDEFIMCIMAHLVTDDVREGFIKFIEQNPEITSEELTLMSISLYRNEL